MTPTTLAGLDPTGRVDRHAFVAIEGPPGAGSSALADTLGVALGCTPIAGRAEPIRLATRAGHGLGLSGLLRADELVKRQRLVGPAVVDTWATSVAADSAAIYRADSTRLSGQVAEYRAVLEEPTVTVHLTASARTLRDRLSAQRSLSADDRGWLTRRGALERVADAHRALAHDVDTRHAIVVDIDNRSAQAIADAVIAGLKARHITLADATAA
ncbi:hypothetical protein [Embleya sp. NBC_00896]|uniref:hypothetical protein n=1 Tax=Embleya sp. NBC_00896 TaxID=2975961 RepID=UPI002F912401|nr:hypothetical protein OG928_41420 [Embleya sp. NBC_00896]